ncbi:MAG: LysR substrate-binding domain-containing protein [Acidiferrobacterales bacterium]|nr:LysR substrate-binding domain-containing protein [Acidiferrobacterales bacterium]
MNITFRKIRYFIAVADSGKISSAATNLNISQSAVSAAIMSLEEEIGAPLFQRQSGGVQLTYEGYQFLSHAQNILAAVSEATRGLRLSGRTLQGKVKVGLTYTVSGYFIPQILTRFSRSFPEVVVQMHEWHRDDIESKIANGEIDIAVILVSNLRNTEEIDSKVLLRSRRRLWLWADHPLLNVDPIGFSEVSEQPYIMLTVDEAENSAMRYWSSTGFTPNVVFKTTSVEAVRSMVATGMGVTILSDMVYRPWSLEGQHVEVKNVVGPVESMDVGLIWNKNLEMNPPAKAFFDYLSLTFSDAGLGWHQQ